MAHLAFDFGLSGPPMDDQIPSSSTRPAYPPLQANWSQPPVQSSSGLSIQDLAAHNAALAQPWAHSSQAEPANSGPSHPISLVPSPTAYRFESGVFDWAAAQARGGNEGFVELDNFSEYGTPSYVGSWRSSSVLDSDPSTFAQINQSATADGVNRLGFVWDRDATLQIGRKQPTTEMSLDNLTGLGSYRDPLPYDDLSGAASQSGRSASPAPSAWAASESGLDLDGSGQTNDETAATAAQFSQLLRNQHSPQPSHISPPPNSQSFGFSPSPARDGYATSSTAPLSSPALSPPILSVPQTRASPALPQLTIPSGLQAPSLNLIQATPASAAPRTAKGAGTLELERVFNMFTTGNKVSAFSRTSLLFDRVKRRVGGCCRPMDVTRGLCGRTPHGRAQRVRQDRPSARPTEADLPIL